MNVKPNADKEINKIIACHNKNLGCSVYFCEECKEYTFIGHTCKSRFCTSCGYKYKLSRVENIVQTAYNCKHRHIVFTCAKELWPYFFVNFDKMINIYFQAPIEAVEEFEQDGELSGLPISTPPYTICSQCNYDKCVPLDYKSKRGYHHIYKEN